MLKRFFKLEFKPADLKKPTVVILILANLLPIYGVLFLGWEVFPNLAAILDGKRYDRGLHRPENNCM